METRCPWIRKKTSERTKQENEHHASLQAATQTLERNRSLGRRHFMVGESRAAEVALGPNRSMSSSTLDSPGMVNCDDVVGVDERWVRG
jgi:hypothetical protein